ncbi:MAG: hypothetical protein ABSE59_11050, partial [Opitutaceae bacterium]
GVAGILLFWQRLSELRSWLTILLLAGLFWGAWKLMGFDHSPMASGVSFKGNFYSQWWMLLVWFTAGLGLRATGFRWIAWPLRDPMSVLVLVTVAGLLSFSLFCKLYWGNEHYGIYFLQCVFSLFAFSRLKPGWWRGAARSELILEWLKVLKGGMIFFTVGGLAIGAVCFIVHGHSGISSFALKLGLSFLLLAAAIGGSALMRRSTRFAAGGSAFLLGLLLVGFLAWISPWMNFGLGRMELDTQLTPGEVRGLDRLKAISKSGELFATNKHAVAHPMIKPERSYGYGALSERPVLLAGLWLGGETFLPTYRTLQADNDSLFSTTNPAVLRRIAEKYGVAFIVARPGTDIALRRPLPPWLHEEEDCGDLRIYRIQ